VTVPRLTTQPPLPPTVYLRRARGQLPWPLEEEGTTLHARARHGLWHGLKALGLKDGDEILLPAWQHGSEIETIERSGCRAVLYDVDRSTTAPDADVLERLVTDRTRALYLIHYLGWPRDAIRWKGWCEDRGLHLIEDCAQCFLSQDAGIPLGSTGSMSIFCIYKTVGIPDGSVLHCSVPARVDTRGAAAGWGAAMRGNAEWLLQSRNLVAFVRGSREAAVYGADDFALGDPDQPPSRASAGLLRRLLADSIVERRVDNFRVLFEHLEEITPPPFRDLPSGATPLVYPVAVTDKPVYLRRLAERGVIGLNLWSVPHERIAQSDTPEARWLREHIVGLPVHQELKARHVEHIANAALWAADA